MHSSSSTEGRKLAFSTIQGEYFYLFATTITKSIYSQFDMQQLLHTPNFAMRQFMDWDSAEAFYTSCFDAGEVCILNLRGEVVRHSKRIDEGDSDVEIVSVSFAGDTRANPINIFTPPKRREPEPTEEEKARERRRKQFREYQAAAQAKAYAKSSAATRIVRNGKRSQPLYEDEDGVGVIQVSAANLRGTWIETDEAGPSSTSFEFSFFFYHLPTLSD